VTFSVTLYATGNCLVATNGNGGGITAVTVEHVGTLTGLKDTATMLYLDRIPSHVHKECGVEQSLTKNHIY
jgi:hypothetical protein